MWFACHRASWEPRLPIRMGFFGLLYSFMICLGYVGRLVGAVVRCETSVFQHRFYAGFFA